MDLCSQTGLSANRKTLTLFVRILTFLFLSFNHYPLLLAQTKCAEQMAQTVAHNHFDLLTYTAGMEKSSHQKAASTVYVIPGGRVADIGSGSGVSAYDMSVLFPNAQVVGVDLDSSMISLANERYHRDNLTFIQGNGLDLIFPKHSLTGVFCSSTGHHYTSYGEGLFDTTHIHTAFQRAREQLEDHGIFTFRDFLIAEGPEQIILEIPTTDGQESGSPEELSTAALFMKFTQEFRSSQHLISGVPFERLKSNEEGWARFLVSYRDATEFILRKDYKASYAAEIKEEYTYMNQVQFEEAFRAAGFRVLLSKPIYNPWIISNRFEGKVRLTDISGNTLPFPATNYIIVGEAVKSTEGFFIRETRAEVTTSPHFLQFNRMQEIGTGQVWDVIERPHLTIDILPYYHSKRQYYVIAKQGFPRPIVTVESNHLDGTKTNGYFVEPITFINAGRESQFKMIETELQKRAGIKPTDLSIKGPNNIYQYYASPGIISEKIQSIAVPIKHQFPSRVYKPENYTDLSTAGMVRSFEATQVLRAGQVGSVIDARMEISVYNLLLDEQKTVGPWIGDKIDPKITAAKVYPRKIHPAHQILNPKQKSRRFKIIPPQPDNAEYLEIHRSQFSEFDGSNESIATVQREYVVPKHFSNFVASTLPFVKSGDEIYVGIEHRHLPGVQLHEGTSDHISNPAWRLPKDITNLDKAKQFVQDSLLKLHINVIQIWMLGGSYYPTPGVTPEVIYPMALEVTPEAMKSNTLKWVSLRDLINNRNSIHDSHLNIVAFRLAHATGILK